MTLTQKFRMYKFQTAEQRRQAWYALTEAAYRGKRLEDVVLVFDRWGGVHVREKTQ